MVTLANYIRNPFGNRWIRVDGPTYQKLIEHGRISRRKLQRLPVTQRPVPKARDYPKLSNSESRKHLQEISNLPIDQSSFTKPGRGGKTRGWGKVKPRRGRERRELYNICGRSCFFQPDAATPGKSGYPVCRSLHHVRSTNKSCQLDCRGIQTAKQYATRFNPELAQRISWVQDTVRCT
jgi:hypothetical protein